MKEHARRRARYLALESLYESGTSGRSTVAALDRRVAQLKEEDPRQLRKGAEGFAREMVRGVGETGGAADSLIAEAAPRYALDTMAIVDRNILRLAIWELLTDTSAPVAAVVNEAVELAHRYGGETSPGFVNGVLRTVSAKLAAGRRPVTAAPATNQESESSGE